MEFWCQNWWLVLIVKVQETYEQSVQFSWLFHSLLLLVQDSGNSFNVVLQRPITIYHCILWNFVILFMVWINEHCLSICLSIWLDHNRPNRVPSYIFANHTSIFSKWTVKKNQNEVESQFVTLWQAGTHKKVLGLFFL